MGSSIGDKNYEDKKHRGTSKDGESSMINNNNRTGKTQGLLKTEGLSPMRTGQSIKFNKSVEASDGTVQELHDKDGRKSEATATGVDVDVHHRARQKRKRECATQAGPDIAQKPPPPP